jgi:death-on-curing protein
VEPLFLELAEVLLIHQDQLKHYGGKGGIRDLGLLKSAVAIPRAGLSDRYLHEDIYEMAAAYLFHIVRDHPFVDGNKRTGVVAALVFLAMNDAGISPAENELEDLVWAVAEGSAIKAEVARFFRDAERV